MNIPESEWMNVKRETTMFLLCVNMICKPGCDLDELERTDLYKNKHVLF